ncbi:aspartic proteinase-like isoform X1 [Senna tora]|uniref:Aspartic proteinase-like isoform X1 n=1 Tax=Senna tora TaxID=362788 RepID=A0A834WLD8_9FABA|nr:aspartic proteinase-like isoform X1 [Senna tora]
MDRPSSIWILWFVWFFCPKLAPNKIRDGTCSDSPYDLDNSVVVEINHTIGAEGVLSSKCKEVVSHYGVRIWDLLVANVDPDKVC